MTEPRTWLTAKEVAEYARCSLKTVSRALEAGDLRGSQITTPRGTWRIKREWVDAWLEAKAVA